MLIPKYRSRKEAPTPKIICHVHTARVFFFFIKNQICGNIRSPIESQKVVMHLLFLQLEVENFFFQFKTRKLTKKLYENILIKMRDNDVRRTIEGDDLIMRFGQRLYEEQGHHPHRLPYVAQMENFGFFSI